MPRKQGAVGLPVKLIIVFAAIFSVLICIIVYSRRIILAPDYFKVKDIVVKDADIDRLLYLKGKDMLGLDLKYEAGRILELYPDCNKVKMIRLLPDRIFVDFVKRKPVAILKLYRYFFVDEDAVLFNPLVIPEELGLPVINGLDTRKIFPKSGKRCNIKELFAALNIIEEVKHSKALNNYKISRIDIAVFNNTTVFFSFSRNVGLTKEYKSLEVRLAAGSIKEKISILSGLILTAKDDIARIKYIDLRFKEPVIRLKDAE